MSQARRVRVLDAADLDAVLTPELAVGAMRTAFGELSGGTAVMPPRGRLEGGNGVMLLMSAWLGSAELLGAKLVSVFPENAARGEPTVRGVVQLFDARTGQLKALLDGERLTEIRTAAGSALATRLIADPAAEVMAVLGAGAQGRSHAKIIPAVRGGIREVRIWSRTRERAEALARELREDGAAGRAARFEAVAVGCVDDALRGAGVVVTATPAEAPLFAADCLEDGAHVNAVGSFTPAMQELDPGFVARARIVVDQRAAAMAEAGDLIRAREVGAIGPDAVDAELGEIVNGTAPRGSCGRRFTLYKSVGVAAQDVAIAGVALAKAQEQGVGREVDL